MQSRQAKGFLPRRWPVAAFGLIVIGMSLFVTGVMIERGAEVHAPTSTQQETPSGISSAQDPDGGHEETPSTTGEQGGAQAETIFGLDLENPWLVGAYVLVWLLLGVALFRPWRIAWWVLLLVSLLTLIFDVGEVIRQLTFANPLLVSFALLVALTHLALAVLAGFVLARNPRVSRPSLS